MFEFLKKPRDIEERIFTMDDMDDSVREGFAEFMDLMSVATKTAERGVKNTPAEFALIFAAFHHWRYAKESFPEWTPGYASASARRAACDCIALAWTKEPIRAAVQKQRPDFDAARELRLADLRCPPDKYGWGDTVTRFTIIGCRVMAYAATGEEGRLTHIDIEDDIALLRLGRDISRPALGQSAFRALYPIAKEALEDF